MAATRPTELRGANTAGIPAYRPTPGHEVMEELVRLDATNACAGVGDWNGPKKDILARATTRGYENLSTKTIPETRKQIALRILERSEEENPDLSKALQDCCDNKINIKDLTERWPSKTKEGGDVKSNRRADIIAGSSRRERQARST